MNFPEMGKNPYLTEVKRAQIATVHRNRSSQHQISKQQGFSKSSVQRAIEKFNRERIYGSRNKSTSSSKSTPRDENGVKHIVVQSRMISCKKIRVQLLRV